MALLIQGSIWFAFRGSLALPLFRSAKNAFKSVKSEVSIGAVGLGFDFEKKRLPFYSVRFVLVQGWMHHHTSKDRSISCVLFH
jgi:hypothetical protein